jgi:iron complex outermembrane receptor protein
VPQDLVAGKTGAAVEGDMDARSALEKILAPSGLSFEFVAADAARILSAPPAHLAVPHPAPADREPTMLDEVTVTARRRQEPLQEVPISVAVVSGDELEAKNLHNIADISSLLPSVDFRPNTSQKDRTVFIRGVGTVTTSQNPEPSVATVIDGVVVARSGQAMLDLVDVDRIEVLSGPQGTLFGKNASGGVINIITKNPTSTPSGYFDAAYYQGNEYRIGAGISGPITEDIKGRLSVFAGGYDGNMENLYDHQKVDGYEHQGGRAKLIAAPLTTLTLTFAADFTHSLENMPAGAYTSSGWVVYCPSYLVNPPAPNPCKPNTLRAFPTIAALLAAEGIHPSANNTTISNNSSNDDYDDNGGVSLQADWALGAGYSLISISAWRDWRNSVPAFDYDQFSLYTAQVPQIQDAGRVAFTQVSQELRMVSPKGHFIDYVAGLYYMRGVDHELYERAVTEFVSAQNPAQFGDGINHFGSSDDNYAVFGEANLNFTQSLRALIGYREVWDRLTYSTDRISTAPATNPLPGVAPSFADAGGESQTGWSGRTGLQYDVNPDIATYATVSRGYKGPSYNVFFNMASANTVPLSPETSNSYEVGIKSQLFGRRVQLDVAGFITDFHNYVATSSQAVAGATITNLINAGSVTTRGVEAGISAIPIAGLSYRLDALYDDAYIQRFPCPPAAALSCHIDGDPLPFAPEWKLFGEQDYRYPLSDSLDLDVDTDYRWQSPMSFQLILTSDMTQPAYGIWNASLGLIGTHNGWSVHVLVKNILDQHYSTNLQDGNLGGGVVRWVPRDNNRYAGINVHKDF